MRTRYWGCQYLKPFLHEEKFITWHPLNAAGGLHLENWWRKTIPGKWRKLIWLIENWFVFVILSRVKAAQSELGTQILADFEEAFPSQGSKVIILSQCLRLLLPACTEPVPDFELFCLRAEICRAQQRAPRRLPGGQRVGPAHQTGSHQEVHPAAPLGVPGVVSGKPRRE